MYRYFVAFNLGNRKEEIFLFYSNCLELYGYSVLQPKIGKFKL